MPPNRSPYVTLATILASLPPDARSMSTARGWLADGRLPSTKIGKRRLIRRDDAAKFLGIDPSELVEAD